MPSDELICSLNVIFVSHPFSKQVNGPWTANYSNLAGSTLKTTFTEGADPLATNSLSREAKTFTRLTTNTLDQLGRVMKSTDADGVTSLTAYNAKGEAFRRALDLNGNGQIDAADRVTDSIQDILEIPDFGPAIRRRSLIYDENNAAITVSTSLRSPNGQKSRQESLGVAAPATAQGASYEDKSDGTWTETSTAPDGTQQVTTYENWLATTSSSLDSAGTTLESQQVSYDAFHRPTTQTHSRTGAVTTTYSPSGQVTSINDHDRITSFSYDNMGRRVSTTLPDGSVSHTSYWITGQVKATWGSQTNPTVKFYDTEGRLTKLRTFRSSNLTLAPDESTADFDETTWIFNTRGQLTRKQYADGKGTNYTYTPGGRMHTRTWARGVTTTYDYSSAGELVSTDYSDTTPDVAVTFDKLGRQLSISNGIAKSEFTYNANTLRLTTETLSYNLDGQAGFEFTRTLDRSRDTLGRDSGFQLRNGNTPENHAIYTYGPASRLASITAPSGTFNYSYLPNSNLIAQVAGPAHTVTNTYEANRNVLTSKENKVDTTTISKYVYTVNPIGQRTSLAQTGTAFATAKSIDWSYDPLGQVTTANSSENTQDRAYQYDTIGNRQKSAESLTLPAANNYTANALNQYTAVNTVNPSYDQDGNTLTEGNKTYTWDAENRLIKVQIGETEVTYQYDAQSRRIARAEGLEKSVFLYDGWNNIAEYQLLNSQFTLLNSYTWGLDLSNTLQGAGGVGGLLSVTNFPLPLGEGQGEGNTFYVLYDGNGNISEYLDEEGATTAHFEYDPFGNTTVNTDTENQFPYRFSTKPLDFTTNLYYYGYRWYEAPTGRWKSRDPIEEQGGVNLHGFVGNDGVNAIDYLGNKTLNNIYSNSSMVVEDYEFDIGKDGDRTTKGGEIRFFVESEISPEGCVMRIVIPIVLSAKYTSPIGGDNQGAGIEDLPGYKASLDVAAQRAMLPILQEGINKKWGNNTICCDSIRGQQYKGVSASAKLITTTKEKYCCCKIEIVLREDNRGARLHLFTNESSAASEQWNWNVGFKGVSAGNIAAHEIGHWLGNIDEHSNASHIRRKGHGADLGPGMPKDVGNSIMSEHLNKVDSRASDRHFWRVLKAIDEDGDWKGCKIKND